MSGPSEADGSELDNPAWSKAILSHISQRNTATTGSNPPRSGFDKKVVHLANDSAEKVKFKIEVDFLGNGTWNRYDTLTVFAKGYVHHEFPDGFSAHWVRVGVDSDCTATVYFMYN